MQTAWSGQLRKGDWKSFDGRCMMAHHKRLCAIQQRPMQLYENCNPTPIGSLVISPVDGDKDFQNKIERCPSHVNQSQQYRELCNQATQLANALRLELPRNADCVCKCGKCKNYHHARTEPPQRMPSAAIAFED